MTELTYLIPHTVYTTAYKRVSDTDELSLTRVLEVEESWGLLFNGYGSDDAIKFAVIDRRKLLIAKIKYGI